MITQQEQNDIVKNEMYKHLAESYHWADLKSENITLAADRIESILQICIDILGNHLVVGALFSAMSEVRSIRVLADNLHEVAS